MFILQTLQDFINNPMGRGSNAIPSRQLIKDDLDRRYDLMFPSEIGKESGLRRNSIYKPPNVKSKVHDKKITLNIYKDKHEYYFHFTVPSEGKERRNTYDVVLHFTVADEPEIANDSNLNRYYVKFFSNSPSFTYTFAYAFNLYGLFVEELKDKFRKETFSHPPVTRNPGEIISYEKTIYFACHYLLLDRKYLNKIVIDSMAKPFNKAEFVKNIRNTDKISVEIKQDKVRAEREEQSKLKAAVLTKKEEPSSRKGTIASKDKLGAQLKSSRHITPKGKITPKKSSINKIKPR